MVRYWFTRGGSHWRARALVNGVGATATGVVALVVVYTKFAGGAWLVTVAIPMLVLGMLGVRRHYERLARRLRAGAEAVVAAPAAHNTTLLVVEQIDEAAERALRVRPGDLERRRPRDSRAGARNRPGHPFALVQARGRTARGA